MAKKKNKNKKKVEKIVNRGRPGQYSVGTNNGNDTKTDTKEQETTTTETKKNNNGSRYKKLKDTGNRIVNSLKVQEDAGQKKTQQLRNRKPKPVENLGSKSNAGNAKKNKTSSKLKSLSNSAKNNSKSNSKSNSKNNNASKRTTSSKKNTSTAINRFGLGNTSSYAKGVSTSNKGKGKTKTNSKFGTKTSTYAPGVSKAKNPTSKLNGVNNKTSTYASPDALEKNALVDPSSLGPLGNDYKKLMKQLGDVQGINTQLSSAMDELKIANRNQKAAFETQSAANARSLADLQITTADTISSLEESRRADRAAYDASLQQLGNVYSSQEAMNERMARIQERQQRKADNLARAYVPGMEDSLGSVQYGDNRKRKRKDKNNRLSDLRINTGLSNKPSNSTAGLQLA